MFKIDKWNVELSASFKVPATLFESSNRVIAVQGETVIAVLWKVPDGFMRIDSYGIAIALDESRHTILLAPKKTLDEIFACETELQKTNST